MDELDLQVVRELEIDARQSLRDIAGKVGTSAETVRKRLNSLLETRAISIHTICNVIALGLNTRALITIKVLPGKASSVVEQLRSHHCIHKISLTAGHYDILISTNFVNQSSLVRFVERDLGGIPEVTEVSAMMLLQLRKNSFRYLYGESAEMKRTIRYDLDELDLKLMKELEQHPRELVGNLGKKIGLNRISTGKKLQALLDRNIVNVVSIIDPLSFGLASEVVIFVKVSPAMIMSVSDKLVANNRVHHVGIITGAFNIFSAAVFRDSTDLADFLVNDLGTFEGIISYETMITVASSKMHFFAATQLESIVSAGKSAER